MSSKKPIHEIRLGRIKAAVWENETEHGIRFGITLSRLYKNGKDEWKDSTSFGRDDLPLVEKVCHMTHLWIFSHSQGGVVQAVAGNGESENEEF
jgi:hypothetical protein